MSALAVGVIRTPSPETTFGRVAGPINVSGLVAVGRTECRRPKKAAAMIRTRPLDPERVRCVTIGGARTDTA